MDIILFNSLVRHFHFPPILPWYSIKIVLFFHFSRWIKFPDFFQVLLRTLKNVFGFFLKAVVSTLSWMADRSWHDVDGLRFHTRCHYLESVKVQNMINTTVVNRANVLWYVWASEFTLHGALTSAEWSDELIGITATGHCTLSRWNTPAYAMHRTRYSSTIIVTYFPINDTLAF